VPSIDDYPIRADGDGLPPDERSRSGLWILLAVALVVAALVAAYLLFRSPPADDDVAIVSEGAPAATGSETLPPLGADPRDVDLPPLDMTDPVVRELLSALSSRPELMAWLATDNVLRRGVAVIDNVARGRTPATHFRSVAPRGAFQADPAGKDQYTTSRQSYSRYDGLAQTLASLDTDGMATAYATLRPRLIEAYQALGYPDGNIDLAVERAIVHLLQTPDVAGDAPVAPSDVMYKYVDPRLEGLSEAQKQLLRMGPENARVVKQTLRELAAALGIPDDRLPRR